MEPDKISLPFSTLTGSDSPVRADVFIIDLPSITTPSKGTFSPAFTTIISSMFISSGETFLISLFIFNYKYIIIIEIY